MTFGRNLTSTRMRRRPQASVRNMDSRRSLRGSSAALLASMLVFAGCEDSDEPTDVREYHGGPSRVICGQRWSLDHRTFYCNDRFFPLGELRHFPTLEGVRLVNTAVIADGHVFSGIRNLHFQRARPFDKHVLRWFPFVVSLVLDRTIVDYEPLGELAKLRFVTFSKVPPPTAAHLVAISSLDTVNLVHLRCPKDGCAMELARELHALRPAVTIRVDGNELRW
jgi:hypothetical protein